jgi:hypothetical protein
MVPPAAMFRTMSLPAFDRGDKQIMIDPPTASVEMMM